MLNWVENAMNGAAVERFHTVPTINNESVGQHSFGVAMMVLAITEQKASAELLKAALFHDMAEQVTGDTPFTAKRRFPIVKSALAVAEEQWEQENGFHVALNPADLNVLKWADMLQLLYYCKMQRDLGNTNMNNVFHNGVDFLRGLQLTGKCGDILGWLVFNYKGE
jgi:hypothetical protein